MKIRHARIPPARQPVLRPVALLLAAAIGWSAGACAQGANPAVAASAVDAHALRSLAAQAVEAQLADSGLAAGASRTEVEAGALDSRLRMEACATEPMAEVDLGRGSGRYNVKVSCSGPSPWSLYVPVEVRVFRPVVVASRALPRGAVLGAADLRLEERNALAPGAAGLQSLDEAVGMSLRRNVAVNAMITTSTVEAPLLVRRGDRVQLAVNSGGISVSATAEALRDGRRGERITVRNLQSKRVVEGVVTAPGRVEVR